MNTITLNQIKKFLKETLLIGFIISVTVFAWVRALLFEVPFSVYEDGIVLAKTIGTGWLIIISIRLAWYGLLSVGETMQNFKIRPVLKTQLTIKLVVIIALSTLLYACNAQQAGISKDMNTGLVTSYKGLTTGETKMIMNGEVLNHTDIPLGESFVITNEKVKGLTIKDNKVSVGCALTITDKNGKTLLSEPDLFKGQDVFEKDKADYLKCTVNTGKPMEWEEKYDVTVVFTDKFGKGRIENKVTIRAIDIP
jgi:hypothetical protein